MIENNFNEELLTNDEVLKDEKVLNNEEVNNNGDVEQKQNTSIIENLDDTTIFTPVISDNIFEEEILNFDENNSNNNLIENKISNDNTSEILDDINDINDHIVEESEDIIKSQDDVSIENLNNNLETNEEEIKDSIDTLNTNTNEEKREPDETDFTKLDEIVSDEEVVSKENPINSNVEEIKKDNQKSDTLLEKYGENFSVKEYVCNPAIGRDNEIKQLILTLLTPEKSGILVGKPGIGKTAIVEGLGYQIQMGNVPDALKEYQIYKLNTSSLLGVMPGTNEPKIQVLLNEIKGQTKLILFIDEIHTLIGAGADGDDSLDFANIFKPGLDRGNIKIIGATTSDEYDRYILTDKAFVRRFQKIDVLEPTKEHTVKIMMGSLPKLEKKTGAKLKYTSFIQEKIMTFIVDLTTEYRRVYELSARYPDVALTILQQAFSYAVFDNKKEVSIRDIRKAIVNTKLVYSDVIKKELIRFNDVFSDIYLMETPQKLKGETDI